MQFRAAWKTLLDRDATSTTVTATTAPGKDWARPRFAPPRAPEDDVLDGEAMAYPLERDAAVVVPAGLARLSICACVCGVMGLFFAPFAPLGWMLGRRARAVTRVGAPRWMWLAANWGFHLGRCVSVVCALFLLLWVAGALA